MNTTTIREIYLDYAAATPLDPKVLEVMQPFLTTQFANPGSLHAKGEETRLALESARAEVCQLLNIQGGRVIFTASGTESINLALQGIARALAKKGKHIISQPTEHHAVLQTLEYLKSQGFEITLVPVDKFGQVSPDEVAAAIRPDTILCTIMYVNNETGVIQPIQEIAKVCRAKNILFHTDACQAGMCDLNMTQVGIDLLTLDGAKLCGPRGVGALCVSSTVKGSILHPLLFGGDQEFGLRPGTENVAAIVGFTKALAITQQGKENEFARLWHLHKRLLTGLVPFGGRLNGHESERVPHIINASFGGAEAERVVLQLSDKCIFVSAGSACTSRTMKTSHVLSAMRLSTAQSHASIRISMGRFTTNTDIDACISVMQLLLKKGEEQ